MMLVFLKRVLVPQLVKIFLRGEFSLILVENCHIWSREKLYDNQWNKIMEAIIQNYAQPMYFVDHIYFPIVKSATKGVAESHHVKCHSRWSLFIT